MKNQRGGQDRRRRWLSGALTLLVAFVLMNARPAPGKQKPPKEPQFRYVGGTENVADGCRGRLEVTSTAVTFRCAESTVRVPYAAIASMDYRSNVRSRVAKLKIDWKVRPPRGRGKRNRYFAIVYSEEGRTRVVVLDVLPEEMQPYLAEIELQSEKRIDVMRHDDYE